MGTGVPSRGTSGGAAAAAAEHRFADLADIAPAMLWVTDAENRCVYLSQGWYEFTGQTEAEGLGFGWTNAVHPDDRDPSAATFVAAAEAREAFALDYRLRRKDGAYRWAIDAGRPRYDEDGAFAGYVGSVIDVHERKQVEEALREREVHMELATHAAQVGIWEWEIATGVVIWSPLHKEMWGYEPTPGPIAFEDWRDRIVPEDVDVALAAIARSLEGGEDYDVEYRIVPEGSTETRWIRSFGRAARDETGAPVTMHGVTLDVSKEKAVELELAAVAALAEWRAELADTLRPLTDAAQIQIEATRLLGQRLGADRVLYAEVDDAAGTVTVAHEYLAGLLSAAGTYPIDDFGRPVAEAMRSGSTLVHDDVRTDPELTEQEVAAFTAVGIAAHVTACLAKDGRAVAVLGAHAAQPRAWSQEEVGLVEEVAERTWAAVQRARAETALRERDASFRALFTSIDEGYCLCELVYDESGAPVDYRFLEVNPLFEPMTGLSDAVGRTAYELVPDLEPLWVETYAKVALGGEPLRFESGSEAMGRVFDVFATAVEPRGRFALIFKEITERKRAEAERAALLESERAARLEAERRATAALALASINEGVVLVDDAGAVQLWNPAASAITGVAEPDVAGRALDGVLPGWADLAQRVPLSAEGQAGAPPVILPLVLGGRELWLAVRGSTFPGGTVFTFRDVTDERALEQMRSDLIATISHELRTPLTAVYGAALTLLRDDLEFDREKHRPLLEMIQGQSERLASMVDDILLASRLDAGHVPIEADSFDPVALARETIDDVTHARPQAGVELVADVEVPEVVADRDKVGQVMRNLVENAVKYGGPLARLELRAEEHRLRFAVVDSGPGIPPEERPRIWEKFYRGDPQMNGGVGGSGLGLYICRELVERMEGRIWVESPPGGGAAFRVEIPLG